MKEQKATVRALFGFGNDLTDRQMITLTDSANRSRVIELLDSLEREQVSNIFVTPLDDSDLPENLQLLIGKYRRLASEFGYAGPIARRVKPGFTLKWHAPKAGPCYQDFGYLQDWRFEDTPTPDAIVFWVPRLVRESTSNNVKAQLALLEDLRRRYELPDHHLSSFGSVALNAALILEHLKRTGERVPLDRNHIRTDTLREGGRRLSLGYFVEYGLNCDRWDDGDRNDDLGCFALGVEALGI